LIINIKNCFFLIIFFFALKTLILFIKRFLCIEKWTTRKEFIYFLFFVLNYWIKYIKIHLKLSFYFLLIINYFLLL